MKKKETISFTPKQKQDSICVRGARENNLQNVDVDIPRDQLVVITGISGSGKSSLAFNTIYAEGQRRYLESLSSYARQFLGRLEKPDIDSIEGLSPSIAIEQKSTHNNPRSTVGTVTEIYDYLRLLFARAGIPHCPKCDDRLEAVTVDTIVERIMDQVKLNTRMEICAPLVRNKKGEYKKLFEQFVSEGFIRVKINGEMQDLTEKFTLEKNKRHNIDLIIDRLVYKEKSQNRLAESIETALKYGNGLVSIWNESREYNFSSKLQCLKCNVIINELEPRLFSFNSPQGACNECHGLGVTLQFDANLIIGDPEESMLNGALKPWNYSWGRDTRGFISYIKDLCDYYNVQLNIAWEAIPDALKHLFLYGDSDDSEAPTGILKELKKKYEQVYSNRFKRFLNSFMTEMTCEHCNGSRLSPQASAARFHKHTIHELCQFNIQKLLVWLNSLKLKEKELQIVGQAFREVRARLSFLEGVGVSYLTLARSSGTLSGGETQRIRLATQIGSALTGVLYVLDEPSIGLHQKDNNALLRTLKRIRDLGNSVLVVEHDEDTIQEADYVIDVGPGAGAHGGKIVACGTPEDIKKSKESITGQYLRKEKFIPIKKIRRLHSGMIHLRKVSLNNIKNLNVDFPLGVFTCVTGVSGSGKSSLVNGILYKHLHNYFSHYTHYDLPPGSLKGHEIIDRVVNITQDPIGRTPRSNPATYTGVFTDIRNLFTFLPEAASRGYQSGRFSFNVSGGRCENCAGTGTICIEMHFLPDVYIVCDVCHGKRFNKETLEVKYKGKSIFNVLDMTAEEALEFFADIPSIYKKLKTLNQVGLDYIRLGQFATTLSGGEAQRVKLATELSKTSSGHAIYILDEPTTGLHFADVERLVKVLHNLVNLGNSVVVIEHNLDVIKTADYVIDMGPDGGENGGKVIAKGTPEGIAKIKSSDTGFYLKSILAHGKYKEED